MRSRRTFLTLAVATLAVVVAAVLARQRPQSIPGAGSLLFPHLLAHVDAVARVAGSGPGGPFTVVRHGDHWVVTEKEGYPAATERVRELVLGMSQLVRLEPKTRNPKLYAELGLGGSRSSREAPVRVALSDASGHQLAALVIGNSKPAPGSGGEREYYVRLPHAARTWLVQGDLPAARTPADWLARRILQIDRERVREVRVTHPDGDIVTVERPTPATGKFELGDVPAGAKVKSAYDLDEIVRAMTQLSLIDVQPRAAVKFGGRPVLEAELMTFDGLHVTMRTTVVDGHTWARLHAAYDPSLVHDLHGRAPPRAPARGGASASSSRRGASAAGAASGHPSPQTPARLRSEVRALNAHWAKWVYELPPYRAASLGETKGELIEPAGSSPKPRSGSAEGAGDPSE